MNQFAEDHPGEDWNAPTVEFIPGTNTLVMREELFAQHPWVAEAMFKACEAAKKWAIEQMRYSGAQRLMLPWLFDEIAEMQALMGDNAWAYGVERNRPLLEAFMGYLVEQAFLETAVPIDALFAPIVGWSE